MMARAKKAPLAFGLAGGGGFVAAFAVSVLAAATVGATTGCGGSKTAANTAKLPDGTHVEEIQHEPCDEAGHRVETLDANGDGKADVRRVYDKSSGKELCRITDLDRDGRPDMFEYFDASGQLRRREADYDTSGVVNGIEFYDGGKLVRRELDTTGQHRIDTWDYFDPASGKRIRRERDSTNDGKVDQWWTWDGDKVTIAMDRNGDGKPDPTDTVTVGGSDNGSSSSSAVDAGAAAAPDAAVAAPPPAPVPVATDLPIDAGPPAEPDAGAKKHGGKKK